VFKEGSFSRRSASPAKSADALYDDLGVDVPSWAYLLGRHFTALSWTCRGSGKGVMLVVRDHLSGACSPSFMKLMLFMARISPGAGHAPPLLVCGKYGIEVPALYQTLFG
jgi:hypothetical protein